MNIPYTCPNQEGHEAHMEMNGECPWCGEEDQTQINHDFNVDDFY